METWGIHRNNNTLFIYCIIIFNLNKSNTKHAYYPPNCLTPTRKPIIIKHTFICIHNETANLGAQKGYLLGNRFWVPIAAKPMAWSATAFPDELSPQHLICPSSFSPCIAVTNYAWTPLFLFTYLPSLLITLVYESTVNALTILFLMPLMDSHLKPYFFPFLTLLLPKIPFIWPWTPGQFVIHCFANCFFKILFTTHTAFHCHHLLLRVIADIQLCC